MVGHVGASEQFCMTSHFMDKVLYRKNTPKKVLYENAHSGQGFVNYLFLKFAE
jgi:hypothetical protein